MKFAPINKSEIVVGQSLPWPIFDEEANVIFQAGDIVPSEDHLMALLSCCRTLYRPDKNRATAGNKK